MLEMSTFEPVRRLDATPGGLDQQDLRPAADLPRPGRWRDVGAGYVTDRRGRRFVLTWQADIAASRHRTIAELVGIARSHGVPAPRYAHVLEVGNDVAVLQEMLPGSPPRRATPELVEAMVAVNDRLRCALADRTDVSPAQLYLQQSGPGFCLHETLQAYSARTHRLLTRIRQIGDTAPAVMTGDDLVHMDFQPENMLVDDTGALTGIVDWDGAARGDAAMDLLVLFFGLHSAGGSAATIARLEERLRLEVPVEPTSTDQASRSARRMP
jgi:aminoglycoside phosphotransferase (APT) family kinase protein